MRKCSIALFLFCLLWSYAYCQVDTLRVVEYGTFEAPLWILELYVEDLDGDQLKEIIICTVYNILVYNSQTYELEWASPQLHIPTDLVFADANSDGLKDISARDDYRIYLFDPHNSVTIWTGPLLDTHFKGYAMGNRNGDGWGDVAIATSEIFSRYEDCSNMDTSWIEVYDGPDYVEPDTIAFLLANYDCHTIGDWRDIHYESIYDIKMYNLSGTGGIQPVYMVFIRTDHYFGMDGYPLFLHDIMGSIKGIDGNTLSESYASLTGLNLTRNLVETDTSAFLYTVSINIQDLPLFGDINLFGNKLGSTGRVLFKNLKYWHNAAHQLWFWRGSIIDEFDAGNGEMETCFGVNDTLSAVPLDSNFPSWTINDLSGLREVLFSFNNSLIFSEAQVVCKVQIPQLEFRFYNGSDGSLRAILPDPGRELTMVDDYDNDGIDEIFSLHRERLRIYKIDYATGVNNNSVLPQQFFLRQNYPNPFNSFTAIEYGLEKPGHVTIEIFDLLGRKVKTLIDKEMQVGQHSIVWDASSYSAGVYFYRMESGDFTETKRMVYLK